jgi:hypothetical protein
VGAVDESAPGSMFRFRRTLGRGGPGCGVPFAAHRLGIGSCIAPDGRTGAGRAEAQHDLTVPKETAETVPCWTKVLQIGHFAGHRQGTEGPPFSSTSAWETGFDHLRRFVAREGHGRVPFDHVDDDGYRLGAWCNMQRHK